MGASLFSLGAMALAQTTPSLKEITVTGNPLGATDLIAPAAQYSGTGLLLRSQTTLGETLSGTPSVSSTYFGPNAAGPSSAGWTVTASASCPIAAPPWTRPASASTMRSPPTPSASNASRCCAAQAHCYTEAAPWVEWSTSSTTASAEPLEGVTGKADLGLASGNRERAAAFMLEGGNQRLGLHADVFNRSTQDVRVPISLACTKDGVTNFASRYRELGQRRARRGRGRRCSSTRAISAHPWPATATTTGRWPRMRSRSRHALAALRRRGRSAGPGWLDQERQGRISATRITAIPSSTPARPAPSQEPGQ